MIDPRPLSHDLTDQGKYQLAHGEPSTTHTPGPWSPGGRCGSMQPDSVKKYNGQPYQEITRVQVTTSDGFIKHIAHVFQGEGGVGSPQALEEQAANMALICAAPDLLEQLEEARQYVAKVSADYAGDSVGMFASRRLERMEAVIAKATGGTE